MDLNSIREKINKEGHNAITIEELNFLKTLSIEDVSGFINLITKKVTKVDEESTIKIRAINKEMIELGVIEGSKFRELQKRRASLGINPRSRLVKIAFDKNENATEKEKNLKNREFQNLLTVKIQEENIKKNTVNEYYKHVADTLMQSFTGIILKEVSNTNPTAQMLKLLSKTQSGFKQELSEELPDKMMRLISELGVKINSKGKKTEFLPEEKGASALTYFTASIRGWALNASGGSDLHVKNSMDFFNGISAIKDSVDEGVIMSEKTEMLLLSLEAMDLGDKKLIKDSYPTTKGWDNVLLPIARYLNTKEGSSQNNFFKESWPQLKGYLLAINSKVKEKYPNMVSMDTPISGQDSAGSTVGDVIPDERIDYLAHIEVENQVGILKKYLRDTEQWDDLYIDIWLDDYSEQEGVQERAWEKYNSNEKLGIKNEYLLPSTGKLTGKLELSDKLSKKMKATALKLNHQQATPFKKNNTTQGISRN